MSVPAGLRVIETDNPEPYCVERVNCYSVEHRAIVIVPEQSLRVWAHEACHAHQHQTVLDELDREPSRDLREWYNTTEAVEYSRTVGDAPVPDGWVLSAATLLEDFAEACARYMVNDSRWASDPARDAFFAERDFR